MDQDLSPLASAYRRAAPVLDAVWQMVGAVALGALGGWWLDKKLATSPWLMVAGSVIGVTAGLAMFLRAALSMDRRRGPGNGEGPRKG